MCFPSYTQANTNFTQKLDTLYSFNPHSSCTSYFKFLNADRFSFGLRKFFDDLFKLDLHT